MRKTIEKMAKGNIDYRLPEIQISENKIYVELEPDSEAYGEFVISSSNNKEIKGVIYSENEIVSVTTNQFAGRRCNIRYKIIIKNGKPGEIVNGKINIVSNAGPAAVPYHIYIKEKSVATTVGNVKNLDDFAQLVQTNYEEAFKIFYSDRFKKNIIKNDMRKSAIYDGLVENWNRNLSMEEFLIATDMKKPVTISVDKSSEEYKDLSENVSGIIDIKKSGWGYVDISAEVKGAFLYNCKQKVTLDDFAGNNYEYEYLINISKLHKGINKGKIIFTTYGQKIEYDVIVRVSYENREHFATGKQYIYELMKSYLLFRTDKISVSQWLSDTEKLVDERLEKFPKDYLSMLIRAQVLLSTGRQDEAAAIISEAGNVIIPNRQSAMELYCYYLYLKTLQKNNPAFTSDIKKEIQGYYDNGCEKWELLWILLYLEEKYKANPSLKYALIKEQFGHGITSPMLYFEALKTLNEQPGLLRVLNKFEIQIICFGSKYKCISSGLKAQLLEIISSSKISGSLMYHILKSIYEEHPDKDVLEAICSLLIRENKTDNKYFKWYDKAVRAGLNITRLYEFYMYSIDKKYEGELLPAIYMYFNYNADTIAMQKDFLYCNIVMHKQDKPSTYESYKKIINDYAMDQIRLGNMNSCLKEIYNDILYSELITEDTAGPLSAILETYKISCDNPAMKEVVVYHKESMHGRKAKLENGEAYVCIYTKAPVIVFIDCYGNRYCGGISYTIEKLMDNDSFLKKCLEKDEKNEYLLLHYAEEYMDTGKEMEAVEVFSKITDWEEIGGIYKRELIKEIVDFYSENYDGNALDDYIGRINMEKLDTDTRNKIMEIMVSRGNVESAVKCINDYGYEGINPAKLSVFCSIQIETSEYADDRLILEMCYFAFQNGRYDENTLKYMSKYYYGTTDEMYALWEKCVSNNCNETGFEEKLIAQMLFERNCDKLEPVFVSYAESGGDHKIKNAVLSYYAFEGFIKDKDVAYEIYEIMENELYNKYDMPDICKIAFLQYFSKAEEPAEKTLKMCKKLLLELSEYNVNFEFFKRYNKWFEVPANILDKTVFDYKAEPSCRVMMKYRHIYEENSGKWITVEMGQTYPGVIVKELPLFYGDEVEYSFVVSDGNEERETNSVLRRIEDKSIYNNQSRFGMINSMIICKELGRESSLIQLAKTYTVNKKVADKLFKIL